jgi:hypothetical protein
MMIAYTLIYPRVDKYDTEKAIKSPSPEVRNLGIIRTNTELSLFNVY